MQCLGSIIIPFVLKYADNVHVAWKFFIHVNSHCYIQSYLFVETTISFLYRFSLIFTAVSLSQTAYKKVCYIINMNITQLIEAEQMLYACSKLEPADMKSENTWLNNAGLYRRHLVLLKNTFEYHKYNHLKPASSKMIKYTMSWHSLFSGAMERLKILKIER